MYEFMRNFYKEYFDINDRLINETKWAMRFHPRLRENASERLTQYLKDRDYISQRIKEYDKNPN